MVEVRLSGGAGYGDPSTREAERIAADVADGFVTPEAAGTLYGRAVPAAAE